VPALRALALTITAQHPSQPATEPAETILPPIPATYLRRLEELLEAKAGIQPPRIALARGRDRRTASGPAVQPACVLMLPPGSTSRRALERFLARRELELLDSRGTSQFDLPWNSFLIERRPA